MTKFDIFVVNLKRSADRREAMREKIARIRGFKEIYIDDEMVVDSVDSQNLEGGLPRRFCESARNDDFLDSSLTAFAHNDNLNLDSANRNNSSLRNFAKQSCGNPQGFARAVARSNHLPIDKVKDSQSGLPRRFYESARNDDFLDSSLTAFAHNDNLNLDSANRGQITESATFCHSESFSCHSERSEESKKNNPLILSEAKNLKTQNRDSSVATLPQNDNVGVDSANSQKSQSGLPRAINCARNDKFLLDSAPRAESTLNFHFFPATDATDFKNEKSPLPPQYSSKLTRFVKGKDLSFGEMACFSSHYRLWQKCVALDSPIIVLEDDIDFMQDFCQIVDIFKSPFEYVRLYYLFDRKITHLYDNFYISFGNISGAQGYYLTPQAAQKFIKNARFWLFCVDDYMDMFFIHSVKNIIFKPFIISEDLHSVSTILGREKPQMRFYQKLTRELSRIYFFVIRKYLYFALHFAELRAFFRAHKVAQKK